MIIIRTLRSQDGEGGKSSPKNLYSSSFSLHRDDYIEFHHAPGIEFIRIISKLRKGKKISSRLIHVLRTQNETPSKTCSNRKEMYTDVCGRAKLFFSFFKFSSPKSSSLALKVPYSLS